MSHEDKRDGKRWTPEQRRVLGPLTTNLRRKLNGLTDDPGGAEDARCAVEGQLRTARLFGKSVVRKDMRTGRERR